MHYCELHRPSSTGKLIQRLVPASGCFVAGGGRPLDRGTVVRPGRELWILHPHGELPPTGATPEGTQVLLIDGSWKQASDLLRSVSSWGRMVRLPMSGSSRFLLRTKQDSTMGIKFSRSMEKALRNGISSPKRSKLLREH